MTSRSKVKQRLDVFERLRAGADEEQQQRARALAGSRDAVAHASAKLQQLKEYRADYLVRMQSAYEGSGQWGLIHAMRQFLQRLDDAIALQEAEVARLQQALQHVTGQWTKARQNVQAYEALSEQQREALLRQTRCELARELQEWSSGVAADLGAASRPAPL